jgi:hypothetical protein
MKRHLRNSAAFVDRFFGGCFIPDETDASGGGSPPAPAADTPPAAGADVTPPPADAPPVDAVVDWRKAIAGEDTAILDRLKPYEKPADLIARLDVDWRKQMAGEDADALKFLERYNDPAAAYKAWRGAVAKLSEGGSVKVPGPNATPEELAEWNKNFGVAAAPDKYEITAKPSEEVAKIITDDDKAMLGEITSRVHEAFTKGPVKAGDLINLAHQVYYDVTQKANVGSDERAVQLAAQGEIENRKAWGDANYDKMIDYAIEGGKQFFPGTESEFYKFMGRRFEGGSALFDDPIFQRMLANIGTKTVEDPVFLEMASGNTNFNPQKRLDEIHAMRNGSTLQRAEYARLSAPGGEMERLLSALERRKSGGKAA